MDDQTIIPGARMSGLMRPSIVGPRLENGATVEGLMRSLIEFPTAEGRLSAALNDAPTLWLTHAMPLKDNTKRFGLLF
jgi:hypothetical protein